MHKALMGAVLLFASVGPAFAGIRIIAPSSIPTLDDIGLTALTIVVGIAGGIVARRRNKKK